MIELQFSIMDTKPEANQSIQLALDEFGRLHNVKVNLKILSWDTGWSELVKIALYKTGPDVSETGISWVDGFVSANALRRFEQHEIDEWDGPSVFLPSLWPKRTAPADSSIWAIPWMGDTRVVYYRRDFLRQAGIDEASAFSAIENFSHTLNRLQQSGVAIPLAIPTVQQHPTMHILALWVWGTGGRFISPNGRHVLFHTAAARRGIDAYFNLRRYLVPDAFNLEDYPASMLFRVKSAAVIVTGIWFLHELRSPETAFEAIENVGVAVLPVPYVGGSNLVVWKHTRHPKAALALIRFLTSREVQLEALSKNSLLPARFDALNAPPFTTDPRYQAISESFKKGRSFAAARMWGLVEDKLTKTISRIWAELLNDPDLPVEETVTKYIDPLARELNQLLAT